ncbi:MAG: ATP cone domain-containing protein [Patescibacteria group bacterium]
MSPSKKPAKKVVAKAKKASTKTVKAPEREVKKREPLFIKKIMKRSGQIVDFDLDRMVNAIHKAMLSVNEGSLEEAEIVATKVYADLVRISKKYKTFIPSVEGIQDTIESELILSEYVKTAKSYILYRAEHAKIREKHIEVPEHVKKLAAESKKSFRNPLGEFIYYRTYSRWIEEQGRRETWRETVTRYMDFMKENLGDKLTSKEYAEVDKAIFIHEAMPSMRALQFAGPAARKNHTCVYNCSFTAPQSFQDFAEIMFLSMSGAGVGFSAESYAAQSLPQIKYQTGKVVDYVVEDSREGWADSFSFAMEQWFGGNDVRIDYSKLRPAGARLKTTGGKSSGPDPLRQIHDFTRAKIFSRQGQHLSNLDVHDIICQIGMGVVSGGVRRTALISLSDLNDGEVRDAKKGQFWMSEPQRSLSNNSAVYNTKPTNTQFLDEWTALVKSGSGERGIFNRAGLKHTFPESRKAVSEGWWDKFGTNPCGEIILRPKQFCNLSEAVARHEDTEKDLMRKIRIATILGTYQATFTNFIYLSPEWKKNCEEERLLGVSITGMWDCPAVRNAKTLRALREETVRVNAIYAKRFGINPSTAITTVKPSGNLSQTVDCSSGMHARHSQYYIRRVRISATDALFKMMKDQGVPYSPEVGQTIDNATTYVIDFPVKAPKNSKFSSELSAIDQLNFWKLVKENYTHHNPSVTVSIGEDEWIAVASWVYENWNIVGGLSFLPRSNHVYQLAPYEECTEKQYNELLKRYERLDFSKIVVFERRDETDVKKELACAGGVCEIEDAAVTAMEAQKVK